MLLLKLICFITAIVSGFSGRFSTPEELLELGDNALSSDDVTTAIKFYLRGIEGIDDDESILTALSLYTNLGTSYSSVGEEVKAIEMYRNAILYYSDTIEEIVDKTILKSASDLAAQTSFFLGLSHQEIGNSQKAVDAYAYANTLDPFHWASLANLGSVLHDNLKEPADALAVYNKAFHILTQTEVEPTDVPEDPKLILSQLQYRIGLCITYSENQKCVMQDDPTKEVACTEMAANAFSQAIELDPENETAKHMLATVTADASMSRASNAYVTKLFEDYAEDFETSLVDNLGYDGFKRLRHAFDVATGGVADKFDVVVDAGCGTGLVGEQFRNVSDTLIGVDLSPSIIEEAEKVRPDLYDETYAGDVTAVFIEKKDEISMIIAADSYIYFGDLVPLFEAMEVGLVDNGLIAFTLENAMEDDEIRLRETRPDWRWQLTPSGRFAHNRDYVEAVGKEHSLKTIHYEQMNGFRKEGRNDVRGHIFIMQKVIKDEL